jgi:hypothetical protein
VSRATVAEGSRLNRVQQHDPVVRIFLTVHPPMKRTLACRAQARAYTALRVPPAQIDGGTHALPFPVR